MWKHPTLTGLVCLLLGALVLPAGPRKPAIPVSKLFSSPVLNAMQ